MFSFWNLTIFKYSSLIIVENEPLGVPKPAWLQGCLVILPLIPLEIGTKDGEKKQESKDANVEGIEVESWPPFRGERFRDFQILLSYIQYINTIS